VPFAPTERAAGNVLAAVDSTYSRLEVVDYGSLLGLRTDQRSGVVYSFYPKPVDGNVRWPYGTGLYDYFAVAPLINGADDALLLGLGAGTLPLLHEQANPDLRITGVELDPTVVELGRRYFGLDERSNTRVVVDDARPFLHEDTSRHDLIELDLFRGGTEVPFYLATQEFFQLVADHLNEDGLLAMNVYDPSAERTLLNPVLETIASVLPNTYYVAAPGGSYFVLAAREPIDLAPLRGQRLHAELTKVVLTFERELVRFEPTPNARVLTDDTAPLEQLTHAALGR
jgi:spermidine synthase